MEILNNNFFYDCFIPILILLLGIIVQIIVVVFRREKLRIVLRFTIAFLIFWIWFGLTRFAILYPQAWLTNAPQAADESGITPNATVSEIPFSYPKLQRSPDLVIVCDAHGTDLSTLQIDIGLNESYVFNRYFPATSLSRGQDCWCLFRSDALGNFSSCSNNFIEVVGASETNWRNNPLTVYLNDHALGQCEAQERLRDLYDCDYLN